MPIPKPGKVWKPTPYKFPLRAEERRPYVRVQRPKAKDERETLTGLVQGKDASDIEERAARAMSALSAVRSFEFRVLYFSPEGIGGGAELDFLVQAGLRWGVQIDGEFSHKSAEARAHDALQDARLGERLMKGGAIDQPIVRVPGFELASQELADRFFERLF